MMPFDDTSNLDAMDPGTVETPTDVSHTKHPLVAGSFHSWKPPVAPQATIRVAPRAAAKTKGRRTPKGRQTPKGKAAARQQAAGSAFMKAFLKSHK